MNLNSKRHNNRLQCAALLRWVVITVFLGAAGLSYLYLKNQLYVLGTQRTHREGELRDLLAQSNVLKERISELTSFNQVRRHLENGSLKMIPISDRAVAHVHPLEINRWAVTDAGTGNQFQTISHESGPRH